MIAAAGRAALVATIAALALPAAADDFRLLRLDGMTVRWDGTALGKGATVSWGFATEAARFPSAVNCRTMVPIDALAAAWRGDPARLGAATRTAFAMWSRAADLRFREAGPGETPDILIGAQGAPDGVAFANVWHGPGTGGVAPITRASVCLNPEVAWTTDDGPPPPRTYDLVTVLAHEIGHAIGLDHPGAHGALMAYSEDGPLDALMPGDVAGVVVLYGPSRMSKATPGTK